MGMSEEEIERDWKQIGNKLEEIFTMKTLTNPTDFVSKDNQILYRNKKGRTIITLEKVDDDGNTIWDIPVLFYSIDKLRDLHAAITLVLEEFPPESPPVKLPF
tara:strand:- start:5959 stop:6267 length:309 start_codon:yes stop_codon:yes gene_type:complete